MSFIYKKDLLKDEIHLFLTEINVELFCHFSKSTVPSVYGRICDNKKFSRKLHRTISAIMYIIM